MMNDSTMEIIPKNSPKFQPQGPWDYCPDAHDWQILCFKDDVGIAICKKCARLEGGWIKYE